MKCKLICMDIDGTLLNDEKKIPDRVKRSIQKAKARGIRIALATGRMPRGADLVEEELKVPCIKICSAGTYILMGDDCISNKVMAPEVLCRMEKEFSERYQVPFWFFLGREWYVTGIDSFVEREMEIMGCRPKLVRASEIAEIWKRSGTGPNKILFAAEAKTIQNLRREIEKAGIPGIDMACSAEVFLEIFPQKVSKGTALTAICRKLGIPREETIAFGDQELDLPLIEAAGIGIAMGNAIEKLKARADYVTKTNNDGGIADALEHYLNV